MDSYRSSLSCYTTQYIRNHMSVIIPIGYAFFDNTKYKSHPIQRLLIIKRKQILYKEVWKIYEESFHSNWALIFANMREAHPIILSLDNNRFPDITSCLRGVNFSRLKEISLENNRIASMEPLISIDMPQVQTINLQSNKISSIKSFRKNSFKRLTYLNLSANCLQQMRNIAEFNNIGLIKLILQWDDSPPTSTSISWTFKMYVKNLKFIRLESQNRIRESKMDLMFSWCHPNAIVSQYCLFK